MSNIIREPLPRDDQKKDELMESRDELASVLTAYNKFVDDRLKLELNLDQIRVVPSDQIHRISQRETDLALILQTGEILISEEVTDRRERFDVVSHELLHQGRMSAGIDNRTITGSQLLEEGIIQECTQRLSERNNMVSQRTREIYYFEAWVARNLAMNLGVQSLIDLDHKQIRSLMAKKYTLWGDPYDILIDDMIYFLAAYRDIIKQVERLGPSEEDSSALKEIHAQQFQFEKDKVARFWGFVN